MDTTGLSVEEATGPASQRAADEALSAMAALAVACILGAYIGGRVNLDQCLEQLRETPAEPLSLFPRYEDWIVVEALKFIDGHYDEAPEVLRELRARLLLCA